MNKLLPRPPLLSPGLCYGAGLLPAGPLVGSVITTVTPPDRPAGSDIIRPGHKDKMAVNYSPGPLELRDLTLTDSGDYRFVITPVAGEQQSGEITLGVYGEFSFCGRSCSNIYEPT